MKDWTGPLTTPRGRHSGPFRLAEDSDKDDSSETSTGHIVGWTLSALVRVLCLRLGLGALPLAHAHALALTFALRLLSSASSSTFLAVSSCRFYLLTGRLDFTSVLTSGFSAPLNLIIRHNNPTLPQPLLRSFASLPIPIISVSRPQGH